MEIGNFRPIELLCNFAGGGGYSRKWSKIWNVNDLKVPELQGE